MNDLLLIFMSFTGILVVYWVVLGQWKHNKMMKEKKQQVKAVLFDMDGVIIDSIDAWYSVFNSTLMHLKNKIITKKEFTDNVWGISFEKAAKEYFDDISVSKLKKVYFKDEEKFIKNTDLMDGAKEILEELKKKGVKTAIVSNTSKDVVKKLLSHHKILESFSFVLGGDSIKNPKPAPDALQKACEELGFLAEDCVFVGDTINDKQASKKAGMAFIGYKIDGDFKVDDLRKISGLI